MRYLGIDYGAKRIGFSISDSRGIVATPLENYSTLGMRKDIDYISELARSRGAEAFVVGLPKNMDGSEGDRAETTRKFGDILTKATGLSVNYFDERLTSVQVERALSEGSVKRKDQKGMVDKLAAQIILQAYLDRINR